MSTERQRPDSNVRRFWSALGIRARLMLLAIVALIPLLLDRVREIELDRSERIEAASKQALNLARQGMAAQNEAIVAVRAVLQVAASAHGLMAARDERCDRFLSDSIRQVPWLKTLSFVHPGGRIVCSSNPDAVGADISRTPHYVQAMKTGEFATSGYYVGQRTGPTVLTALPRRGPDGAIDLIVTGPLELSWFAQVAKSLAQSSDAVVTMVDGSGTLLIRQPSRDSFIGKNFADRALVRAMLSASEGVFTGESLDGARRVFGFVELPGTGARLAVGFDESDIVGRANREILASFGGLGLITALVLIGIWYGGERLFVEPLRALVRTAQRLGRGEYKVRAAETAWVADFVPLAAALDDMAGRLAEREQELRDANGQLRELAEIDPLTGIANRRAFNARLMAEWRLAAELEQPIAVLIADVDHFKLFNDYYGHVQGDACLRDVSKVLLAGTRVRSEAPTRAMDAATPPSFRPFTERHADFAARFGGEEFAVIVQGANLEAAVKVAERLRRAVEDLRISHKTTATGFVTISVGVASLVPGTGASAEQLIELADARLYEAKRRGRNQVADSEVALSKAS